MSDGFALDRGNVATAGTSTPISGAAPSAPGPGKGTHTSPSLPRTTAKNVDPATAPQQGPAEAAVPGESTKDTDSRNGAGAWDLGATPRYLRFPETEVGAVSSPQKITLINQGAAPIDIDSLELILRDGAGEPAHPGEFELVQGAAGRLPAWKTMTVEVVFRPSRAVSHIGAHLRAKGHGSHDVVDVTLKAFPVAARPEHAEQRELSVAQHTARHLASGGTPDVQHYGDMLAAVLAARDLTGRTKPGETEANAQIIKLLEPVERRLNQLNDHQGRPAQFGAGNIAGQAILDMSETAVRSWRQQLALGTMIRPEELVTRFRAGAETIRFLTGDHADAPTLQEFDHVSRVVGVGAAAPVLAPPLAALAVEQAALIAFAPRVAASRVVLWALHHPAAALAASEALLGFGVQIGEDGWGDFWGQLRDPQGRWFVIAQVLMDFMHVKSSMSGHDGSPRSPRPTAAGGEPAPDLEGARQRVSKARAILLQVHDAAAEQPVREAVNHDDVHAASAPTKVAPHDSTSPSPHTTRTEPVEPKAGLRPARPADLEELHTKPRNEASLGIAMPTTELVPADVDNAIQQLKASRRVIGDISVLDKVAREAKAGEAGKIGELEAIRRWVREGRTVEVLPEEQNAIDAASGKPRKNPDYRVDGETTEIKTRNKAFPGLDAQDREGQNWVKQRINDANTQIKRSGADSPGSVELQLRGEAELGLPEMERQVRSNFNAERGRGLRRVAIYQHSVLVGEWLRQPDGTVTRAFPSAGNP